MKNVCDVCNRKWSDEDLRRDKWAGVMFCVSDDHLICPECYEEMKASFISSPDNFALWKAEYGFSKDAKRRGLM